MHPLQERRITVARLALTGFVLVCGLLPMFTPFVPPYWAQGIRAAYSMVCHQLPDRTFHIHGVGFGVCQRCLGIYLGVCLAVTILPLAGTLDTFWKRRGRFLVILSMLLLALDWGMSVLTVWESTSMVRLFTGLLFGLVAGHYLEEAVAEWSGEFARSKRGTTDALLPAIPSQHPHK